MGPLFWAEARFISASERKEYEQDRAILPLDRVGHIFFGQRTSIILAQNGITGPTQVPKIQESPDQNH
jgi:hypothetical protein